jgi:hypothetical protein
MPPSSGFSTISESGNKAELFWQSLSEDSPDEKRKMMKKHGFMTYSKALTRWA